MPINNGYLNMLKKHLSLTITDISIYPDENEISCDGFFKIKVNVTDKINPANIVNGGKVTIKDFNSNNIIAEKYISNGTCEIEIYKKPIWKVNECFHLQAIYSGLHEHFLSSHSEKKIFKIKPPVSYNSTESQSVGQTIPGSDIGINTQLKIYYPLNNAYHCFNSKLNIVTEISSALANSTNKKPSGNVTCRIGISFGQQIAPGISNFRILQSQTKKIDRDSSYVTFDFDPKILGNISQPKYIQVIYEGDACFLPSYTLPAANGIKINFTEKDQTTVNLSLLNTSRIYNLSSININAKVVAKNLLAPDNDGYFEFYASNAVNNTKILFDNIKPINGEAKLTIRPGKLSPGTWQIVSRYISDKSKNCYTDSIYNYILLNVYEFTQI